MWLNYLIMKWGGTNLVPRVSRLPAPWSERREGREDERPWERGWGGTGSGKFTGGGRREGWILKVAGTGRNRKKCRSWNHNIRDGNREYKVREAGSSDPHPPLSLPLRRRCCERQLLEDSGSVCVSKNTTKKDWLYGWDKCEYIFNISSGRAWLLQGTNSKKKTLQF